MRDIPPVPDHDIELAGGALALDFANTVGGTHVSPTHDHLRSYGDIASFAVLAGALSPSVAKRLAERAERDGQETRRREARLSSAVRNHVKRQTVEEARKAAFGDTAKVIYGLESMRSRY